MLPQVQTDAVCNVPWARPSILTLKSLQHQGERGGQKQTGADFTAKPACNIMSVHLLTPVRPCVRHPSIVSALLWGIGPCLGWDCASGESGP